MAPKSGTAASSSSSAATTGAAGASEGNQGSSSGGGNGGNTDPHGAPGSAWTTKKAQEDYDRAVGLLTDKSWSMGRLFLSFFYVSWLMNEWIC